MVTNAQSVPHFSQSHCAAYKNLPTKRIKDSLLFQSKLSN